MARLNDEQRTAVETIDGPVVVIAGPGTGKTQILTLRIANIIMQLGEDYAPNILALTFTNAGVLAMRKRLSEFIGPERANEVGIFTFHSFAEEQITRYPEYFSQFIGARPITELEEIQILEEILERGNYKKLKNFAHSFEYYVPNIRDAIRDLKDEAITPEEFAASLPEVERRVLDKLGDSAYLKRKSGNRQKGDLSLTAERRIKEQKEKQEELSRVYAEYQSELEARRLYDFSDMILSVEEELEKNMEFRTELQEKYLYLLVDEHQDTNEAQNRLVEYIASAPVNEGRPNIFTVGDAKQAIYRFQGASLENFLRFKKAYPNVTEVSLVKNYRSTQQVLDAAHSLLPEERALEAGHPEISTVEGKIAVGAFDTRKEELIFLAEDIKKKIDRGVSPSEIAVFYRKNKEAREITDIFEKVGIPFTINSKENILDDREIRKLILLAEAVNNPHNDEALGKALFVDVLDIPADDIVKVFEALRYRTGVITTNTSLFTLISSPEMLEEIGVSNAKALVDTAHLLTTLTRDSKNKDFGDFFQEFVHTVGFWEHIFARRDNVLALRRLERLFDEIKRQLEIHPEYSLSDFLTHIKILKSYNIGIEVGGNDLVDGVRLMTAHGSKGLEFEHVYITNAVDKHWGNPRKQSHGFDIESRKTAGDNDDERRLFYVALTRAKKEATIMWSRVGMDGREYAPSIFLEEVDSRLLTPIDSAPKDVTERMAVLFAPKQERVLSVFDPDYIKTLFLRTTLSVTALNNYKKSPIVYFFRNLIRLPSIQTRPLVFGNIIHDTLEQFFAAGKRAGGVNPGREKLLEYFERSVEKFRVAEKDIEPMRKAGRELLEKYFDRYAEEFTFQVETEKGIATELALPGGETITLYGIVDKIEQLPDGRVRVVDYKTGYRGNIDKKTRADLERQLVFYKFLIDNDAHDDRVSEGVIDFVEEDRTGKFRRLHVPLDRTAVDALIEEIQDFATDILSGEFLTRTYERTPDNEEYFALWELIKKPE